MQEAKKLIKNTTIYALGDIIPKLLSFISFPILTTYLTPADYGIVNYVTTISTVLTTIGFLCVNTYYLVYYYRQDSEIARKRLLGNLTVFIISFNAVLSLLLFCFGPRLFSLWESNIDFYPYIAIGVATTFLGLFGVLPSALYRLQERPTLFTVLNTTRGFLQLGLTLLFVVVYGFDALGALWANFIITAVFAVVFTVITYRNAIFCFDWRQIKAVLRFSLPLLPGSIAYFLVNMSDRILIDKYLTLSDLGIYSTASTLALMLNIVSYGAYKAFEPHFFKTYGQPGFAEMFRKIRNAFCFVLLFGVLGLAIFAREFFEIFSSEKFHTAYFYVPMILIGVYASSMMMLYTTIITAQEKTKLNSAITIFGGCLSVGLNIWLMPRFGLVGASLVSGFVFLAMLGISIYYARLPIGYLRPILAVVFAGAVIFFSVYHLPISGIWSRLIVKGGIFILADLAVLHILGLNIRKLVLVLHSK